MLVSTLLATALAAPQAWRCDGDAVGAHNSGAAVSLLLGQDGSLVSELDWRPPLVRQTNSATGSPKLRIGITYGKATAADQLGPPTDVWLALDTGPGPPFTQITEVTVQFDNGRTWTRSIPPTAQSASAGAAGQYFSSITFPIASKGRYGRPLNVDLLRALEGSRTVDLALRDEKGNLYQSVQYDLSAENRRCLAPSAWSEAERLLRDPDHPYCIPISSTHGAFNVLRPAPPRSTC
jgi:hypothetical protein